MGPAEPRPRGELSSGAALITRQRRVWRRLAGNRNHANRMPPGNPAISIREPEYFPSLPGQARPAVLSIVAKSRSKGNAVKIIFAKGLAGLGMLIVGASANAAPLSGAGHSPTVAIESGHILQVRHRASHGNRGRHLGWHKNNRGRHQGWNGNPGRRQGEGRGRGRGHD